MLTLVHGVAVEHPPLDAPPPAIYVAAPHPGGVDHGPATVLMTLHADTRSPISLVRLANGMRLMVYPSWLHETRHAARRAQLGIVAGTTTRPTSGGVR